MKNLIFIFLIIIIIENCSYSLKIRSQEIAIENFERANVALRKRLYKEAYEINLSIYNNSGLLHFKDRATLNIALIHLEEKSPYYDIKKAENKFREIIKNSSSPFFINLANAWVKYLEGYQNLSEKNQYLTVEMEKRKENEIKMNEEIENLKKNIAEISKEMKKKEKNEKKFKAKIEKNEEKLRNLEKEREELTKEVKTLKEILNKVKEVDTHE